MTQLQLWLGNCSMSFFLLRHAVASPGKGVMGSVYLAGAARRQECSSESGPGASSGTFHALLIGALASCACERAALAARHPHLQAGQPSTYGAMHAADAQVCEAYCDSP